MPRRALLSLLILDVAIAAAAPPGRGSQGLPTLKYEKFKLKNGLEVILSEDHKLPLVAVNLWYHVGPANERPGRTGFAHLFEHMMFQGSKHVKPNEHFRLLEAAGATDINGTTDFDRTNYFETVPSNQLELALWLESDRMGWLPDMLTARNLANQRDVVRNERRQGESAPYDIVEEGLFHQLFPKNHPYYGVVIGSHADIEAAELPEVREFFKQYYSPGNASLAIAGDFDPKTIKALVEKYFGAIPAGPPVPPISATTPPIASERRATITDRVELPRVYMAWLTPPIFKPGDADAGVLARILGGGKSSRLYKKLVFDKQIAQDARAEQNSLLLDSVFEITVTAKPGVKPEDLEQAIEEELARIQQEGPTQAEVEGARNVIETNIVRGLERLGGFGGVSDRLNLYNHYLHDPGYLPKDIARYDAVTPDSVKKFAASLTHNSSAVVYGVPGEKKLEDVPKREDAAAQPPPMPRPDKPEEAWRARPPKPGKSPTLNLPSPLSFKLANGLTVFLVERHNLPVITANVAVRAGSEANPPGRAGLASFTAAMLQEGTEKRPALKLADDVEFIGATLNTNSSADQASAGIRSLSKNSDAAFDLLADVVQHPAFQPEDVERVRKLRLTAILQQKDNPYILASKFLYREVYGEKHPYGYLETGTTESTQATTREDLLNFYRAEYGPANALLSVAGDVTAAQLKSLAEKYFGGWAGVGKAAEPPVPGTALARRIVIVDKAGAPQTMVRVAQVGVTRNNPDYPAVEVMNAALGGLFSSRINLNLREQHGYTYGAFSAFVYRRGPGPFFTGGAIRTDVTAPAVKEIFNELRRIREAPLTPDELSLAKDFLARSLAGRFETTANIADRMGELFIYSLPLDYFRTLPGRIDGVSAADALRVAQKYLTPENMVVIAVGDRAKIEPELKKLELGPMVALDAEGKPIASAAASTASN
ncbi:MAG TPA: pitrilysin family protein [Terriglobales bacterium]|nr:pitrilysin family protein [Terriglobales bacterium]